MLLTVLLLAFGGFYTFKFLTTSQFSPLRNEVATKNTAGPKVTKVTADDLKTSDYFYMTADEENFLSFYTSSSLSLPVLVAKSAVIGPEGQAKSDLAPQVSGIVSPNKTKVAFALPENRKPVIYLQDLTSNTMDLIDLSDKLPKYEINSLNWSEDGSKILFAASLHETSSPQFQVYIGVLDIAAKSFTAIIRDPGVEDLFNQQYASGLRFEPKVKNGNQLLITNGQCAPGPCYDSIYQYNWTTNTLTKSFEGNDLEAGKPITDFDSETNSLIMSDSEMNVYGEKKTIGKIESLSLDTKKKKTLFQKPGYVFNHAQILGGGAIIANMRQIIGMENNSERAPSQWVLINPGAKQEEYLSYNEWYPLKIVGNETALLDQSLGVTNKLSVMNFRTGEIIQLFVNEESKAGFSLLPISTHSK